MSDTATDSAAASGDREELGFEAEVSRLLHMMVHSVYSEREIFLRELISNASDACDKLRYEALTHPDLTAGDADFAIQIAVDKDAKTLTIADNGIGMSKDDLKANLGTIARSGTANFVDNLTGDAKKDVDLIGQFGVGFYSVFMVADKVSVSTRRAGDDAAWVWTSEGTGRYTIEAGDRQTRGTTITMALKDDAGEYLDSFRLEAIIRKYSDHIAVPILLEADAEEPASVDVDADADGADTADAAETTPAEPKRINDGQALWTRPKSDITDEQYTEFYRHTAHAYDTPVHRLHYKAEGMQSYSVLLYVPETRPMDLFDPARKSRVKLYVKKVFIADDTAEILPGWLRFLRGVVDSEDLPLNISREMLQNNPVLERMSKAITKKVVSEFEKLADKEPETFESIWDQFGPVIKEGIYEDFERRDALLKLARFRTTHGDGWTTLGDYVSRMKDKQSAIYYVTGKDEKTVKSSPQLEGFKARGVEVLLLSDPVDDFWLQMSPDYDGKPFKSITRGGSDLADIAGDEAGTDTPKVTDGALATLTVLMKSVLGDKVADVRASDRLTDTAACLVADENAMDIQLERMLKMHQQLDAETPKILEINPSSPLVEKLADRAAGDGAEAALSDAIWLMLDQARILEGELPLDAGDFARRLASVTAAGIV